MWAEVWRGAAWASHRRRQRDFECGEERYVEKSGVVRAAGRMEDRGRLSRTLCQIASGRRGKGERKADDGNGASERVDCARAARILQSICRQFAKSPVAAARAAIVIDFGGTRCDAKPPLTVSGAQV